MLEPGQKLFEYDIVRTIGQGGFAAVYEAKDRLLERQVAIKQLRLDKIKDQKSVKRFIQEARVAAALEHPNLVTIYALRIQNERLYMVLEYLSGGSLLDFINQNGQIPATKAIKLINGICEGLAKLHKKGIIHRDIKAENILLTADGRPKITDFGIAHVPEAAGGMVLTQAGFQPSSVIYSSPEQFRGEKLDVRSDIYQVGELLYHLLSGQHYISLDTIEAQAQTLGHKLRHQVKLYMLTEKAICQDPLPGLNNLPPNASALVPVIEKAMAKRKEERYNDILDLAADLWAAQFQPAGVHV